ncbi:polysaccharide pyruvyl transferase family protein [Paenibacillus thailandensis]|uniref:Polysaccharide pyruvyl transferase family protein n=1 Tax=Paenibacillus thailandensis TaxID=393250 RepID=A0ABW5QZF3_9BACL
MQSTSNAHPMDGLKNELRQILNVIPPGSNIYYIDIPVHSNGGDLLILKGTEAFFKDYGIHVRARYSVLDFPDSLLIPKDHIIVLHGGGNFGDLYPQHQRLREKIVSDYPHHRIVMLPQTIFYKKESEFDRTAQIFNKHKDVHLYVRDTLSFKLASEKFNRCCVYLSPDMAHQLWPIRHAGTPAKELLCFLRTDIEKTKEQERLEAEGRGDYLDWGSLYSRFEQKSIKLIVRLIQRGSGLPMHTIWAKYTDYLVNKAIKRFGSYRSVQTSRLHGHILSCLMDKPNVLLDNSYGKNSNYYQTWTSGIKTASLVVEGQSSKPASVAK